VLALFAIQAYAGLPHMKPCSRLMRDNVPCYLPSGAILTPAPFFTPYLGPYDMRTLAPSITWPPLPAWPPTR
jgi:hypothetical protein